MIDFFNNTKYSYETLQDPTTGYYFLRFTLPHDYPITLYPSTYDPTNPLGYMQLQLDVDSSGTNYTGLDLGTPTINAADSQYILYSYNFQNDLYEFQGISSYRDPFLLGQVTLNDYFASRFTTTWTKNSLNTTYGLSNYVSSGRTSTFDTIPIFSPPPPHKKEKKN
jgi:hypothetical protein